MKPVFKCDYCDFMGTKGKVKEHEPQCVKNYNMRSCYTCKNAKIHFGKDIKSYKYECEKGVELPENHICQRCDHYEMKENPNIVDTPYSKMFNNMFGNSFFGS